MRIKLLILALFFLFFEVSPAFAEFTFTIPKTTISSDEEIETTVNLSLQGQNNKIYYLEGAFKKEGSSNYFGLTWNDSSWVKYSASNFTTLKSITTDQAGKWNGIVKVKIDKDSSLFSGDGTYTLRMKRFTSGGSNFLADNSIALVISSPVSPPTPTPTSPTPTPTPSSGSITSSFTVSNAPSQITSDQSFNVSVNLSLPNNPGEKFYLKGAFRHPDKPSNYFGLTKVESSWIKNNTTATSQLPITTDQAGNWTGNIAVQPDGSDSGFTGTGDYIFKVGRYTNSGSGPTWSNEANIKIISTEIEEQGGTSTPDSPSSTTNPSSSPQSVSKKSVSLSQASKKINYNVASIAGVTVIATPSATPAAITVKTQKQTNPIVWIGLVLVFAGASSLGYIYWKKR